MLTVRSVKAGYGALTVLRGVSLHVQQGEIVAIVGANGAGKTTLLKTISAIVRMRDGQITFNSCDLRSVQPSKIVESGCVMVPEGRQVFAAMTIAENLQLGSYAVHKKNHHKVNETLQKVFSIFPVLYQRKNQLAGTLSGGEQQMLAIGRALMAQPKLLMLDEPSMGLAPLIVKEIFRIIKELREGGTTVLLVEQNSKAALQIADRGYVMETGAIVLEGTSEDLLNNKDVQRAYLGKEYTRINE